MLSRPKRRRRSRPFDPFARSPLDRLMMLSALGLATSFVVLALRSLHVSGLALPAPLLGAVGAGLGAAFALLLSLGPRLRRKERHWPAVGVAASLGFVGVGALVAAASGWDGFASGVLFVATPIALFGLAPRGPALGSAGLWLAIWLVALGARAFGDAPVRLAPRLLDALPTLPIAVASVALSGRALIHFRQREHELRRLAALDELTATANRRFFFEQCQREVARAVRYGRPLSVLMVELDGVRGINERFGHAVGDRVLKDLALALRSALRTHDLVGRYGGTVFALLLPETDRAGAEVVVARCLARVRAFRLDEDAAKELTVGATIGAATFPTSGVSNVDQLLAAADLARDRASNA